MGGGASLELLLPLGTGKQVLELEAPGGAQGAGPFHPLEGACTLGAPGGWVTAFMLLIAGDLWGVSEPQKYCSAWNWCPTPSAPPPPLCCSDVAAVSSSISQSSSNSTMAGVTWGLQTPSQSPGTLACCDEHHRGSPSCPSVCSQVCLPRSLRVPLASSLDGVSWERKAVFGILIRSFCLPFRPSWALHSWELITFTGPA